MSQNTIKPYFTLRGQNYYRYLAIFLLIGLILLSLYLIKVIDYIALTITLPAILGLLFIRFPKLLLYDDRFVVEKKGLIRKFNDYDIFKYSELKTVSYSKGYTNWVELIIMTLLGAAGYGGFSKPDRMTIKTINDDITVYYRFGTRKKFKNTVKEIYKKKPSH
ncbi:hypothetical protein KEM09_21650 [Carboxylicivirga mesophila]|uniref:PH domain-containing protein n=1 Tax=Carboxylicivirga mesophila TaxID=1166478 RepID=A0ABS5KIL6_9BACT|nr:hypothetical protein [Carboxylicivirga mesophila]MBS2214028.1 hypothetical protein [Carboxylicivirga mesophila]